MWYNGPRCTGKRVGIPREPVAVSRTNKPSPYRSRMRKTAIGPHLPFWRAAFEKTGGCARQAGISAQRMPPRGTAAAGPGGEDTTL